MRRLPLLALLFALTLSASTAKKHSYLFVWAGDDAKKSSDFLAVFDADPSSPDYGKVVATKPTGAAGSMPHHTEDVVPANDHLLANGFDAGKTWLFDVSRPLAPKILTSFGDLNGYNHPHSYIRLKNGHVLATFQHHGDHQTGGLVEFSERGQVIRAGSAVVSDAAGMNIQPYSVIAVPALDRAISTSTSMMDHETNPGDRVQWWRLSDLELMRTFTLPPGKGGKENELTGESRLLPDGSLYIHTFHCGLYHVTGLEKDSPHATLVHTFEGDSCGVPILTGHWWLQTVPDKHAVEVLDITDPDHPREVSRVTLDDKQKPHWLSLDSGGQRIVIDSGERGEHRLFIADFDPRTGKLTLDESFRDPGSDRPGVSMDGKTWPHGFKGDAFPHGAVFSR